ncbi:hypothetical protein CDL12_06246 [Handroanthus impetiginosus]|uniref:Pentatricopeptide repeat-containing protein n=1 Tax=Handroanthus impetiginosus TaxID=429701 RepID=A0A2G9HU65_9LAMI|nr:hypothetical protein CDL12_06246 [Handroanthus impetiginosus]
MRISTISLEEAADVFLEMEEAGVVPDAFANAAYLEGLCMHVKRSSKWQRVFYLTWKNKD